MLGATLACCLAFAQPAEPKGLDLKPLPFAWTTQPGYLPVAELAFSADGRMLATTDRDSIRVWTVTDGREKTRMHLPSVSYHTHLAFLPDGKTLLAVGSADTAIRWFDLVTGKLTRERPQLPPLTNNGNFYPTVVRLAPAGDWHLGYGRDGDDIKAMIWDTATGERLSVLQDHPMFILERVLPLGDRRQFVDVTYTADAPLQVWDAAIGKPVRGIGRRRVRLSGAWPDLKGVSPDGRLLAATITGSGGFSRMSTEIWRTDDGVRLTTLPVEATSVAFAADNRTLAVVADNKLRLFDLALDAFNPDYVLPTPGRCSVVSRDGKALAVVLWPHDQQPGALLVGQFPTLPSPLPAVGDLVGDSLSDALAMLASVNEVRSRLAVKAFAARPEQAAAILGTKLAPDSAARRATVADLIRTLDDDSPDVRDKALAELLPLAHRFETLLTSNHTDAKPGEARHRLTTVLAHVREEQAPADLLTDLRTVEVLEAITTPEAKELLTKLAAGADGSRLTAEAKAALERLKKAGR